MNSLKTALINIRRMPYKSLVAITIISITFFVAYTFSLLIVGSQQVLEFFEARPTLMAFFTVKSEEEEINQVKRELEQLDYIDEIKLVSKEEALTYYQEQQDNPLLLELVTADILPASIEISTVDPDNLIKLEKQLIKYDQIDEIVLQRDVIEQLTQWTYSLRLVGITLTSILAVLSLAIIISIISFKIANQSKFVSILRIIGAGSGYILTPYVYEGVIYGLVGSLVGWGAVYACLLYFTPWLQSILGQIIQFPLPWEFFAFQLGIGTGLAVFFSSTASIAAGTKLIRR